MTIPFVGRDDVEMSSIDSQTVVVASLKELCVAVAMTVAEM